MLHVRQIIYCNIFKVHVGLQHTVKIINNGVSHKEIAMSYQKLKKTTIMK